MHVPNERDSHFNWKFDFRLLFLFFVFCLNCDQCWHIHNRNQQIDTNINYGFFQADIAHAQIQKHPAENKAPKNKLWNGYNNTQWFNDLLIFFSAQLVNMHSGLRIQHCISANIHLYVFGFCLLFVFLGDFSNVWYKIVAAKRCWTYKTQYPRITSIHTTHLRDDCLKQTKSIHST